MAEKLQTIIFLVRHGETDRTYVPVRNVDSKRQLTPHGIKQAKKLGEFFNQFAPTAIYTSPLDRCWDTADNIASRLSSQVPITPTEQLLEIYSNEPRREAGERGESIFETILKKHRGEQVLAVTHQYIIGYVVADFLRVGFDEIPCDFADVYRLVFAENKLVEATRLQPAKSV